MDGVNEVSDELGAVGGQVALDGPLSRRRRQASREPLVYTYDIYVCSRIRIRYSKAMPYWISYVHVHVCGTAHVVRVRVRAVLGTGQANERPVDGYSECRVIPVDGSRSM